MPLDPAPDPWFRGGGGLYQQANYPPPGLYPWTPSGGSAPRPLAPLHQTHDVGPAIQYSILNSDKLYVQINIQYKYTGNFNKLLSFVQMTCFKLYVNNISSIRCIKSLYNKYYEIKCINNITSKYPPSLQSTVLYNPAF